VSAACSRHRISLSGQRLRVVLGGWLPLVRDFLPRRGGSKENDTLSLYDQRFLAHLGLDFACNGEDEPSG
jgi:hypothetical protein